MMRLEHLLPAIHSGILDTLEQMSSDDVLDISYRILADTYSTLIQKATTEDDYFALEHALNNFRTLVEPLCGSVGNQMLFDVYTVYAHFQNLKATEAEKCGELESMEIHLDNYELAESKIKEFCVIRQAPVGQSLRVGMLYFRKK